MTESALGKMRVHRVTFAYPGTDPSNGYYLARCGRRDAGPRKIRRMTHGTWRGVTCKDCKKRRL